MKEAWQRTPLSGTEGHVLTVDDDDNYSGGGSEHFKLCLAGKVIPTRHDPLQTILATFEKAWNPPNGLSVQEIGAGVYLFRFLSESDKQAVLNGGSYVFNESLMVLREVDDSCRPSAMDFTFARFWVIAQDIPLAYRTSSIARVIGDHVGNYLGFDDSKARGDFRIRIAVDITKPLNRCVTLRLGGNVATHGLQYENLPIFCCLCGIIGHVTKKCPLRMRASFVDDKQLKFGAWLKAPSEKVSPYQKNYPIYVQGEPYSSSTFVSHDFSAQSSVYQNQRARNKRQRASGCAASVVGETTSINEERLRAENARLREEVERASKIAEKYAANIENQDLIRSLIEGDKAMIMELAIAAMNELVEMAQTQAPLWAGEMLNKDVYFRSFPMGIGPTPLGLKSEASREEATVPINHLKLVEILMDVNEWSSVFSGIVSKAKTLEVLSVGATGTYNGAIQVMTGEFQFPSLMVPTRENYFVRYCKKHDTGTWAVVDVSIHNLLLGSLLKWRRRPSGCLIQALPNAQSEVIWVEHVEVDDREVHDMDRNLVNSSMGYGAKRWVATLERQCSRLASAQHTSPPSGVVTSPEGRRGVLKLAERMMMGFCSGVGASSADTWTTLSVSGEDDDTRFMTTRSRVDDAGRPAGVLLSAATSFSMTIPPNRVFDFLRDPNSISQVNMPGFPLWDIISSTGGHVKEVARIGNGGQDPGNYILLLQVNNEKSNKVQILQESCSDPTGSYVVYSAVDTVAMEAVLNGGSEPPLGQVALLPSGFSVLPKEPSHGGSLVTVAFQSLLHSNPDAELESETVDDATKQFKSAVQRIMTALVTMLS